MDKPERLIKLFSTGKISRREFIASVSALGAAAMLPSILFADRQQHPKRVGDFESAAEGHRSRIHWILHWLRTSWLPLFHTA